MTASVAGEFQGYAEAHHLPEGGASTFIRSDAHQGDHFWPSRGVIDDCEEVAEPAGEQVGTNEVNVEVRECSLGHGDALHRRSDVKLSLGSLAGKALPGPAQHVMAHAWPDGSVGHQGLAPASRC